MEMGQSQAAATLVTYSSISGWVPIVVSSGTKYPNQPKLIRVKSCLMWGASSAGHLRTSFFNTSGLKTSKAFPPLNICQLKCDLAAPSANKGCGFNRLKTLYCASATLIPKGGFTPSEPSK